MNHLRSLQLNYFYTSYIIGAMKDLIQERNEREKMEHSIVKWWNVHYMTPEELRAAQQAEKQEQVSVSTQPGQEMNESQQLQTAEEELHSVEEILEQLELEAKKDEIRKREEIEQAKQRETEIGQENETLSASLEKNTSIEEQAKQTVSQIQMEEAQIVQRVEFVQTNLKRLEGEIARFEDDRISLMEEAKEARADAEKKKQDIEEIKKTITASFDKENENEIKLADDIKRREELSAKQKGFFGESEELAQKRNALDKEVYRLTSQKERIEESIESQINYMWNEYEITLTDAASLRNEELSDLSEMKRNAASIKDSIKRLGDVNVNAIEDYRTLMEEYTFMKNQYDDLKKAEEQLIGFIDELDKAMRKQFEEKFAEIKVEFDKVFKELFGGGKGTIELMEDEDVLEAGIRIIAQPPGKKLQNMMQLSGGEKALTAIALLFAIQNLKPSPFCLLDEIEAALDESNVGRFAGYLHKLTKHTQFIVITHRRGTMEQADRLYGITMQEKGISTLVSVDLIDKDLK